MFKLILTALVLGGAKAKTLPAPSVTDTREATLACYWETYLYPKFSSSDIETNLCNHIIYGDAKLDETTWKITHKQRNIDIDLGGFKNVSEMKIQSPGLRVEIAAGMWQTPKEYVDMASDPAKRETFVRSVVDFLDENNFDGFHLHWGNPGSPDIDQNEARSHLTILLKELKTALVAAGKTLSIAIWSPLASKLNKNFEIGEVYKHVDLVFVMAFGYSGSWFRNTGAFAPLYPGEESKVPEEEYLTVDSSWRSMKKKGALPEKTVLAVAPKGSGFKLKDPEEHGMGAPSIQNAAPSVGGQPKFNELCNMLKPTSDWSRVWDNERKVPYMYKEEEWISYEDVQSVEEKARYANKQGLAGLAVNNLANDDFDGRCNSSNNFPLLRTAKEHLGKSEIQKGDSMPTRHSSILLILAAVVNFTFSK